MMASQFAKSRTGLVRRVVGIVVGAFGFSLLFYTDWRIALGVFLAMYGNNLEQWALWEEVKKLWLKTPSQ